MAYVRLVVEVDEDVKARIDDEATSTDRTVAAVVRRIFDDYFSKVKTPPKKRITKRAKKPTAKSFTKPRKRKTTEGGNPPYGLPW